MDTAQTVQQSVREETEEEHERVTHLHQQLEVNRYSEKKTKHLDVLLIK